MILSPARPAAPVRKSGAAVLRALVLLAGSVFLGACERPGTDPLQGAAGTSGGNAKPAAPAVPASGGAPALPKDLPVFVDVAEEAGLAVMNHTGKPAQKDWIVSAMGGAGIAFDYDGDGDMDLFVIDGTMLTEAGEIVLDDSMRSRLFRNDGGMKFTEVTTEAGIDVRAFGFGGASCDYDADGHPDLFIACWGYNRLLRNRGDGTFEDVTEKAGVAGGEWDMSTSCAWGDVNGDGIADLYVANYCDQRELIERFKKEKMPGRAAKWRGHSVYVGPATTVPQPDRLYIGVGDGTFRDESEARLRNQKALYGFQPVMSDLDLDGDLDIFVANDTQENHLWVNDGKGVFQDLAWQAGVAVSREMSAQACMGVDIADYDRDGWFDITVTNFSHDYNTVYLNRTGKRNVIAFVDSTHAIDLALPSNLRLSWGVKFLDYDNDSWNDYFAACGHVYGEIDGFEATTNTSYRQRCQLLRNSGGTQCRLVEVTDVAGPAFALKRVWRGSVFADFDDDGDTDIWVGALNDKAALFRNDGGNRNAFLRLRLEGTKGMRSPAGARVTVTHPDGRKLVSELHHGASFCCDNDPRQLVGLGNATSVPLVEVRWPDGSAQSFRDVPTRRAFRVVQGKDELLPDRLVTGPASER